jgi:GAF domain-containing protein
MIATGEGPCQDAWDTQEVVVSDDLWVDDRWPKLSPVLNQVGLASALAVPLEGDEGLLGTLNLYSSRAGRFDATAIDLAHLIGSSIAAIMREVSRRRDLATLAAHLQRALKSRPVIEQAKGILMAVNQCSSDRAFAILQAISRRTHVKVRDVAANLVREVSAPSQTC